MLKKERTREELEILLRDQHNVIEQMVVQAGMKDAALSAETAAVVVLMNQRDRAMDGIDALLDAVRIRHGWDKTRLIDYEVYAEVYEMRASLLMSGTNCSKREVVSE